MIWAIFINNQSCNNKAFNYVMFPWLLNLQLHEPTACVIEATKLFKLCSYSCHKMWHKIRRHIFIKEFFKLYFIMLPDVWAEECWLTNTLQKHIQRWARRNHYLWIHWASVEHPSQCPSFLAVAVAFPQPVPNLPSPGSDRRAGHCSRQATLLPLKPLCVSLCMCQCVLWYCRYLV